MSSKLRESSNKSKRLCLISILIYGTGKGLAFIFCFQHLPITCNLLYYLENFNAGIVIMLFALYYIVTFIVLILHFTGHLERWGVEWLVLVLAVTVFPAVIYL